LEVNFYVGQQNQPNSSPAETNRKPAKYRTYIIEFGKAPERKESDRLFG
jgi:hypothetical protein